MRDSLMPRHFFFLACGVYDQPEIVRMMISSSKEKGIDLNAKENFGLTALHVACMNGNTEIVQVFIHTKIDVTESV